MHTCALVERNATRHPDVVATEEQGRQLGWGEFSDNIARLAAVALWVGRISFGLRTIFLHTHSIGAPPVIRRRLPSSKPITRYP